MTDFSTPPLSSASPRPVYHFTPARNFNNDPNGLVYLQGEYHLFYQYNPYGDIWGHMSWGHAVSRDLAAWDHLPVALWEEEGQMMFSGSAVVDVGDTAGFPVAGEGEANPSLVAVYTAHSAAEQTQNLAYSRDQGRTWYKYAGNPIVAIGSPNFRDPKVTWHAASGRWIMVVALADQQKVRFYASPDLKTWEHLSDFGPAGATGGAWECPDFFLLPVEGAAEQRKWVLKVDVSSGAPAGGGGGQYFVGEFDGSRFINDNPTNKILWIDYGKDFYASQSWYGLPESDGRRLWLAWMSNWEYANVTPTSPWRGMMTLPREVSLRALPEGLRMAQRPARELQRLRQRYCHLEEASIQAANEYIARWFIKETALEIMVDFEPGAAQEFGLRMRQSAVQETLVGCQVNPGLVFVDRTRSGEVDFAETFPGRHSFTLPEGALVEGSRFRLHIFLDQHSVEVFACEGLKVISDLIFPAPNSVGMELYQVGGEAYLAALDVWELVRSG